MNESIAFNCRKVKRSNIIHACYTGEKILHIKQEKSSKPFKILQIYQFQFGFRRKHATSHALISLTEKNTCCSRQKSLFACRVSIDFCKAFDIVNHNTSISKL